MERKSHVHRAYLAILAVSAVVAGLGALFAATVAGSGQAATSVAPSNTAEPSVSGTTRVGQTLRTTNGSWTGTTPLRFSYRWYRCQGAGAPDASDCTRIADAANTTYTLRQADAGYRIRSQVVASNDDGQATATSNPTTTVASTRPANTGEPSVSGTTMVGRVLRTTNGSWTGTTPLRFTYRWYRCQGRGAPDASNCTRIANASNATYTLRQADAGFRIRSQVVASNEDGQATATSNPTNVIQSARPTNTTEPSISGTPVVGSRLQANRGQWAGETPITYAYAWLRCNTQGESCGVIPGADNSDYQVRDSDLGRRIRTSVTARNVAGSRTAVSNPTNVVTRQQPPPPPATGTIDASQLQAAGDRLVVAQVRFSPNPVTSSTAPITARVQVTARGGRPVANARVFMRATPRVVRGQTQATGPDGWTTLTLVPNAYFPEPRTGFNVQFFVKAYRPSDPPLGGVAGYRLVQVPLASGA